MSLWQFHAWVDGWNRSQGDENAPEAPSPEEFDAIMSRMIH